MTAPPAAAPGQMAPPFGGLSTPADVQQFAQGSRLGSEPYAHNGPKHHRGKTRERVGADMCAAGNVHYVELRDGRTLIALVEGAQRSTLHQ